MWSRSRAHARAWVGRVGRVSGCQPRRSRRLTNPPRHPAGPLVIAGRVDTAATARRALGPVSICARARCGDSDRTATPCSTNRSHRGPPLYGGWVGEVGPVDAPGTTRRGRGSHTTLIAHHQRPPLRRSDRTHRPPDVKDLGRTVGDHPAHGGVTRQPARGLPADRAQPVQLRRAGALLEEQRGKVHHDGDVRADLTSLRQVPAVQGAAGQLDQRAGATLLGRALVVLTSGTDSGAPSRFQAIARSCAPTARWHRPSNRSRCCDSPRPAGSASRARDRPSQSRPGCPTAARAHRRRPAPPAPDHPPTVSNMCSLCHRHGPHATIFAARR